MPANDDARAGRAAFTHPGFVLFQVARFLIVSDVEMQAVAVGWPNGPSTLDTSA